MSQSKSTPKKSATTKTTNKTPAAKKPTAGKKETVARTYETVPVSDKPKKDGAAAKPKKTADAKTSKTAKESSKQLTDGKDKSKNKSNKKKGSGKSSGKITVETPRSERMVHQVIPYVLVIATLFLGACYLFHDSASKVGVLGGWIHDLFTGLFGWPAFLIPLILINLAVFWRKYVDMHLVGVKLTLSFLAILFTSSLVQVCRVNRVGEVAYKVAEFWKDGHIELAGGGVLGGLLGNACWQVIGFVGSLIVLIPGILVLAMFLLGVTPRYVWTRVCYLWKLRAEERAEQRQIRREQEEERLAEEKERLEQQERERYSRRLREQQEAERRRQEREAAAIAAGAAYDAEQISVPADAPAKNSGKKKGKQHQNEFIDLGDLNSGGAPAAESGDQGKLDFGQGANLDDILAGNEHIARNNQTKINQNVPIRPAEEEPAQKSAPPKKAAPAEDIAMSLAADKTDGRVSDHAADFPSLGKNMGGSADHAEPVVTTATEAAPSPASAENRTEDPLAGLTNIQPVRQKKSTRAQELESDPDFFDINSIFNLRPTPEQEMKNTPEDAETELGLNVEFTPVEDVKPAAAPRVRRVTGAAVSDAPASAAPKAEKPKAEKDKAEEKKGPVMTDASGAPIEEEEPEREYVFPPIDFLAMDTNPHDEDITEELRENAQRLMETLTDFNVRIKEITYSRGPTITRYELKPDAGTKVRTIANLVDDIALSLATTGVRIEAPIPNKPAVGIEVPNRNRATVFLRDLIDSEKFTGEKSRLTAALGMDVAGKPVYFDISKMPHLLIAGATGMGKSVCINSLIVSLLYKAKPDEVRLILIDPKKVEFNIYREIPLLYTPIVIDPKRAAATLACAVAEMERRFELIEKVGVRDIKGYNEAVAGDPEMEHLPHIVIIIDELAELMMVARDQVETSICRIAQKARAAGMHLIIGTQRPSVDVITGVLKANIPSRIACTVASQVDSRTIIDIAGAEKLIGRGDMLFAPVGSFKPQRVQGAFVSEGEVETIVDYVRSNNSKVRYNRAFIENIEAEAARAEASNRKDDGEEEGGGENGDSLFENAVRVAIENNKISTSLLQRKLSIGYGRAAKLIDQMEELGYVSEADGNKPRRILLTKEMFMELVTNGTLEG